MKTTIIFLLAIFIGETAFCETRVWTIQNGKTIEAELLSVIGGKVSLKTPKGKVVKVPEDQFSADDLVYIELETPPRLDLAISRKSRMRVFPDSLSDLPTSQYYDLTAVIKQESSKPYNQELTAELFVIGEEKAGDKHILLDYKKEAFRLTEGSKSVFELSSDTIELIEFDVAGQMRGDLYSGCLIIVTDSRGEVLGYKTKSDWWFEVVDNLRKLPLKKFFDKNGERCFPTSPKRFY